MTSPYTRAAGRGCGASLLQLVVTFVAVVGVFGVPALVSLALPASVAPELRIGAVLCSLLGAMSVLVVGALAFAMTRTATLDPGFAALGLAGRSFIPNLREWHGTALGRELDARYVRRGGLLEVSLAARTGTKVAIGTNVLAGSAQRLLGLTPVPIDPGPLGLVVTADDPGWAQRLLSDPAVRATVEALLSDPTGRELRYLRVEPQVVSLTRQWIDPDAAAPGVPDLVATLARLAEALERQGPPGRVVEERALAASFRRQPALASFALVGVILVLLGIPLLCVVGMLLFARLH